LNARGGAALPPELFPDLEGMREAEEHGEANLSTLPKVSTSKF